MRLILLAVFLTAAIEPMRAMKLEIQPTGGQLRVLLINDDDTPVQVSPIVGYGAPGSRANLLLRVVDDHNREKPLLTKIDIIPEKRTDWLYPGQIIGVEIALARIRRDYGLDTGTYRITALLMVGDKSLSSNAVILVGRE